MAPTDLPLPPMEYRRLGNRGIQLSAISLGGWVTYGGQVGQDTTSSCMQTAWDAGCNFFDTAEVYAQGKSEIEMGQAIKAMKLERSKVVVATKLYWGPGGGINSQGLSKKHILEGTKASLERLGMDYVDLIFAHRPDETVTMEETVRAFNRVLDQGLAYHWGTSEWSAAQLLDAHRIAEKLGLEGPAMEQPEYNMFNREKLEKEYLPLFKHHGLGTTIWSPLASGVLSGKYSASAPPPADSRFAVNKDAMMQGIAQRALESEAGKARLQKVDLMKPIAESLGCTLAQMSLAWCLKNENVSTVITGASKPQQVIENIQSLRIVPKMTDDIMKQLDDILGNKPVQLLAHYKR